MMRRDKLYIYAGFGLVVILVVIFSFISLDRNKYETVLLEKSSIVEEVSANGYLEAPKKINLDFKGSGKLVSLGVKVGDRVSVGDILAKQDSSETLSDKSRIEATLDVAIAARDQLLSDPSSESTWRSGAVERLSYSIKDAYTKADDAVRKRADKLFTPSGSSLSFGIQFDYGGVVYNLRSDDSSENSDISSMRQKIEGMLSSWPLISRLPSSDMLNDSGVTREYLSAIQNMLDKVAGVINSRVAKDSGGNVVYEEFKTDISLARQGISSALDALITSENAMRSASSELSVREAEIRQAEAELKRVGSQLGNTEIIAPANGIVTATGAEIGEIVGSGSPVVSMIPEGALQIRVNISENNVVNVKTGQIARITLDAFDNRSWIGTVIHIDPAETVIGGAVYYQATILFNEPDERMRPGMSANVWIQTDSKEDALLLPISAIVYKDNKTFVQVEQGGKLVEKEVVLGLENSGIIEIESGLLGDEVIVIGQKNN